ncbi:hypothetical protein [Actinomadura litoris]|uniref:CBM11 domain-containing protein n=1 Tax=Actinomadura litoris TaxID=2678616 RepID=A0A7K1L7Q1_9ACTN|nr:hypothetical protein [Actinomadura litoris]MUN40449.1 hypothetical protein [Actinomadura litoris]
MWALTITCVLSAAISVVGAGTAHAGLMQFENGFEGDQSTSWESDSAGDGSAGIEINSGNARTGANNGWVRGQFGGASEKTWVYTAGVPNVAGAGCVAQIYVRPRLRTTLVLEIWTPSGGKRYSVDRTVDGGGWQRVYTDRWPLFGEQNMQFRIVLHGSGDAGVNWVRLDDLVMQCYW